MCCSLPIPARPEKRHDRATVLLKEFTDVELLTLGGIDPDEVSTYMCAADAVLVPSEYEGFGLAALEALACGVPVIATPTGMAPEALSGIDGTYCLPFDLGTWRAALATILEDPDPHVDGAARAAEYSSRRDGRPGASRLPTTVAQGIAMNSTAEQTRRAEVVVVGAGAAGLYAAITAAREGARTVLVSQAPLATTASYWAQGGIAAALGPDDSIELHQADTLGRRPRRRPRQRGARAGRRTRRPPCAT